MLDKVTSLFTKITEKPTFESDMKKVVDIAKNGTTGTKFVLGTGALLLAGFAARGVAKSVTTVAGFVNSKSESKREEECDTSDLNINLDNRCQKEQ